MSNGSPLFSGNAEFLDALYKSYLENPENVDPAWRAYFADLATTDVGGDNGAGLMGTAARSALAEKQVKVLEFISANRYRGHREADLDPLKLLEHPKMPELHLAHYGFTDEELTDEILLASKNKQYAVSEFIHALVQSNPFQSK